MAAFFHQFSYPRRAQSLRAGDAGVIPRGRRLGYSLLHAYGAALDLPDLTVFCVVGDGEAETGPLAGSWHSAKFLDPGPRRRGAADPGLNEAKIANLTLLARSRPRSWRP